MSRIGEDNNGQPTIIEDKGYSVLRDDAIGPKTETKTGLLPVIYGRETDGTPSYPYITGWLEGTIGTAIRQLRKGDYTVPHIQGVIEDLQQALDQVTLWTKPYDSPTTRSLPTEEE